MNSKGIKAIVKHGLLVAISAVLLLVLDNCKKEPEYFTITGRLFVECGSATPLKNTELELVRTQGLMLFCNKRFNDVSTTTDAEGRFSFSYPFSKCDKELSIRFSPSKSLLIPSIHVNMDIDLGDIYVNKNTDAILVLQTDTAYSSNIYLEYQLPGSPYPKTKRLYGPFANNQHIDTGLFTTEKLLQDAPYIKAKNQSYATSWELYDTSKRTTIAGGNEYFTSAVVQCKKYNKLVIKLR